MSMNRFIPFLRKMSEEIQNSDERLLRHYLETESPVKYNDHALEATALDDDLKQYVMNFLKNRSDETDIECECASISDLLKTQSFTPVTAALFIQWYRKDPVNAARYLLHHDAVQSIPEELPASED